MTKDDDSPLGTCMTHDDPDLWFAERGQYDRRVRAVQLCRECPLVGPCREWALERWGLYSGARREMVAVVVGGLTEQDIRAVRRGGEPRGPQRRGRPRGSRSAPVRPAGDDPRSCSACGERPYYAKGLCKRCHHRAWRAAREAAKAVC